MRESIQTEREVAVIAWVECEQVAAGKAKTANHWTLRSVADPLTASTAERVGGGVVA